MGILLEHGPTADVLLEVHESRKQQDQKYGLDNDDKNTSHDWIAYIVKHAGRAVMGPRKFNRSSFRTQMIHVAALAVAAVEWVDRNRR